MIRKIKFSNFYSFAGEQEIDFTANEKKTSYDYASSVSGKGKITKVAAFIGPNASGKSNVMRAFGFIKHFAITAKKPDGLGIPTHSFFDNDKSSQFYLEFETGEKVFYYNFEIKGGVVISEKLEYSASDAEKSEIFAREKNEIKHGKLLIEDEEILKSKYVNEPKDISYLSFLRFARNTPIVEQVYGYMFDNLIPAINEQGDSRTMVDEFNILAIYENNPKLKKEIEEFMRNFDLGLSGFRINKKVEKDRTSYSLFGTHNIDGQKKELLFVYESKGTRSLLFVLAPIFIALRNNGVAIIDELETGLHPEAVSRLVQYFVDENEEGRSQLIFNSHSLDVMRRLDMHQVYLVSKDEECKSEVKRLNESDDARSDANHLGKYLTGMYGAFPKIRV